MPILQQKSQFNRMVNNVVLFISCTNINAQIKMYFVHIAPPLRPY